MGCVYLVEDLKLGCPWALKEMIFPFEEGKEEALKQFKREAQILAKVKHPHLPKVFDYFEEKNRYYLVMEYIDGLNLMEVLEKNGKLHWKKALDYALQICDVLKFLHKQGIIYRDLKPSNVMVDPKGNVYLIDFGIARFFKGKKIWILRFLAIFKNSEFSLTAGFFKMKSAFWKSSFLCLPKTNLTLYFLIFSIDSFKSSFFLKSVIIISLAPLSLKKRTAPRAPFIKPRPIIKIFFPLKSKLFFFIV